MTANGPEYKEEMERAFRGRAEALSEVMTAQEVADYLRISVKTVTRLHIPYAKVGRVRRYLREDVVAYIREKAA